MCKNNGKHNVLRSDMANIAFKIDPLVVWNAHFAIRAPTGSRPHVGAKLEQYMYVVLIIGIALVAVLFNTLFLNIQYYYNVTLTRNLNRIQKYPFIFLERSMHN